MKKNENVNKIVFPKFRKVIYDSLPEKIIYSGLEYNFSSQLKGEKIKIAILDSGCTKHNDLKNTGEAINFCANNKNIFDTLGHSTILSGIIASNNKNGITGYAPSSYVYYAKVIDDSGKCSFNSLIAGVLWAIVKNVDIIVMALGIKYDYKIFYETIKKAYNANICIIASTGEDNEFPASYPEVLSIGNLKKNNANITIKNKKIYTTYLNDKYIQVLGISASTAIVTGVTALIIEENRNLKPNDIYVKLKNIFK
jgi:subtilisin family serine protease